MDSESTAEVTSSLPNSGTTTFDTQPFASSQSAPEDTMDQSGIKLDDAPPDPTPAVVEQPTSDLREETHPLTLEQTVEIKEHIQREDLMNDSELTNGVMADAVAPVVTATEIITLEEPVDASSPAPPAPEEKQATEIAPAEAPRLNEKDTVIPAMEEEPGTVAASDPPQPLSDPVAESVVAEAPKDPAPTPALTSEPSAVVSQLQESSPDHVMQDAPPSPAKVAREREDDEFEDGPATKRPKTEEASSTATDFKVPERPVIDTQVNGAKAEQLLNNTPMTSAQYKALTRVVANVKRVQSSMPFRQPVDYVALNIPSYPTIVKTPMDLKTLEENLKANKYPSVDAFVADFNLIVENCRTFNGPDHSITKLANEMQKAFQKQCEKVPGPDVVEPPVEKKKKSITASAPKPPPARRESRSSLPGSARSPVSAGSQQTFALGPTGVPLIRRDSTTVGDGRPKREIHPPAPRDLPYANQKPKKKKYQLELKFCDKVLGELFKPKYSYCNYPFLTPVDPVALNIPTYHSIIKKPMDLSTIRTKLDQGQYENAKEFEADVRLVFQNCYKFNRPGDLIDTAGHQLENVFNTEFGKKRDFIEQNTPGSGPQSPGSSEAEESEEEEEEDEEEEEEQTQLQILQKQIAAMSKQVEMIQKKKASPPVTNKKAAKGSKLVRKDSKKTAPPKPEKKAPARPVKKEKAPYVSYEQKQDISNRINSLPESKMATALKIIRDNMPNLKVSEHVRNIYFYISNEAILQYELEFLEVSNRHEIQGVQEDELELDIDELSDEVLHKLLIFVRKHAPRADDSPARPAPAVSSAAPTRKKNKPMSKTEQEARIAQVQSGLSAFHNPGAASSCKSISNTCKREIACLLGTPDDEPAPGAESSDGEESSESEEE